LIFILAGPFYSARGVPDWVLLWASYINLEIISYDTYLLPAIAAVVLGGTSILGGRGTFLGTIAGAILITLLQSILSVVQVPEAGRQIIYGVVIVAMLLLYGRERLHQ